MLLLSRSSIEIMLNGIMLHHRIAPKLRRVVWNSITLPTIHIFVEESLFCIRIVMLSSLGPEHRTSRAQK